jgi:predicted Zn-dependent protease
VSSETGCRLKRGLYRLLICWAIWVVGGSAQAASLLDVTLGVVGRDLAPLAGSEPALARVNAGDWAGAAAAWSALAQMQSVPDPLSPLPHELSDQGRARLWESIALLRAGQSSEARDILISALALEPRSSRLYLGAVWLLAETGGVVEAARLAASMPAEHPDSVGALILRIRCWNAAGKDRRALRIRRRAIQAGTTDAWFWYEVGMQEAFLGGPDGPAIERAFMRALRTPGTSPLHYAAFIRMQIAGGGGEGAVRTAVTAASRYPREVSVRHAVESMISEPELRDALEEILKRPLETPGASMLWLALAEGWWAAGENERAIQALRQAVVLNPEDVGLRDLLGRYEDSGGK